MKTLTKSRLITLLTACIVLCMLFISSCQLFKKPCESLCPICDKCISVDCTEHTDKCKGHGSLPNSSDGNQDNTDNCEHSCPTCGGCMDLTSSLENCESKCGAGKESVLLDPINDLVTKAGGAIVREENGETFIANFAQMHSAVVTFRFTSDKATTASFIMNLGKRKANTKITDAIMILLNDELLESSATVPSTTSDSWTEFVEVNLGCVEIAEGINKLELIPVASALENVHNLKYVKFLCDADLTLTGHACESKCEVCGGCTNVACSAPGECQNKCSCNPEVTFQAVEAMVVGGSVNVNEGIVGTIINSTAVITFEIYSPEERTAMLSAIVSSNGTQPLFTDTYATTVNGEAISSEAVMPLGEIFFGYQEVEVAEVQLKAGKNVIVLTHVGTASGTTWYNIKSITLSGAGYTWAEHTCISICVDCGKCTNKNCLEEVCAEKCACLPKYVFDACDDKAVVTGADKNLEENCVGADPFGNTVTITFNVNVAQAGTYKIGVIASANSAEVKFTNMYTFKINDQEQTSEGTLKQGTVFEDYSYTELGMYELNAGNNTISFAITGSMDNTTWYNFRSLVINSAEAIEWKHICENVCPTCGKCTNIPCLKEACAEKCACLPQYVFDACDDKAVVTGADKNLEENCVGANPFGNAVTITFNVNVAKAGNYTLGVIVSANANVAKFTDYYTFTINDVAQTSEGTLKQGATFGDYSYTELGMYELNAGDNTITFAITGSMDSATWYNFRSLVVNSAEVVEWKHTCENVCPTCGKCANLSCVKGICAEKCACLTQYVFDACDDKAIVAGVDKNLDENCVGVNAFGSTVTITFNVNVAKAGKYNIGVIVSANSAEVKFTNMYTFKINGQEQTSEGTLKQGTVFGDYSCVELGLFELQAGDNEISFSITGSMDSATWYNFRSLVIYANEVVAWKE